MLLVLTAGVLVAGVLTVYLSGRDGGGGPGNDTGSEGTAALGDPDPSGQCVEGYAEPVPGTPRYERPLHVIRRTMGTEGSFAVDEMRYFEGPEAPPSDKNYLSTVRRWYVKGRLGGVAARWLVEARTFGAGVAAVAPYGSGGFRSPDWTAFQHETTRPAAVPRKHPGLPGRWAGSPYDFVTGEEPDEDIPGEALTIPGLPTEVVGCLDGT